MTIKFKPLPIEVVERVVDKFIVEIDAQLVAKRCSLIITPEARRWLAEKGYQPQYGARSVARLIQTEIKDKLADELLFGALASGGEAKIEIVAGEVRISAKPKKEAGERKTTATLRA